KAFVAVNCAAIPGELLESELFGHEKGSFTGAVARRIGKFEESSGGTLLLDEIGEMDLRLQAKLLRAVQEREINRVGSNNSIKVDVRILATSNRNMEDEVRAGKFREDLFFRLNVVKLTVPPLRSRPKDIEILAKYFSKSCAEENAIPVRTITPEAITALKDHNWPGNVRELENTIHRAVLLASGEKISAEAIMLTDTSGNLSEKDKAGIGGLVGRTVADVERDLIIDTLKHTLGNRTHAARILGISIRTLRNKLNTYVHDGLAVPTPGASEATGASET
ncbi:MAG: sigma-54-dependent Fis family transcriptional regulator, partial [Candidatus Marinimicrobia bacterium]|nr:sigma-54-dependent Fis family transcriptional regulator [Candidatus Neomarinimicrobiota bacterium]